MAVPQVARTVLAAVIAATAGASQAFDLQGHRGARGLAPENTLPAFATALSLGVTTLELDTGVTSDGVLVVSHEPRPHPDTARGPDGQWLTRPGDPCPHLCRARAVRRRAPEPRHALSHEFP